MTVIWKNKYVEICGQPCTYNRYTLQTQPYYQEFGKYMTIVLNYPNSRVRKFTTFRVVDEVTMVSAIGGALGLFLGFSFYGLSVDFVNLLDAKFCRKRKISSKKSAKKTTQQK